MARSSKKASSAASKPSSAAPKEKKGGSRSSSSKSRKASSPSSSKAGADPKKSRGRGGKETKSSSAAESSSSSSSSAASSSSSSSSSSKEEEDEGEGKDAGGEKDDASSSTSSDSSDDGAESGAASAAAAAAAAAAPKAQRAPLDPAKVKPLVLLVVECQGHLNWKSVFCGGKAHELRPTSTPEEVAAAEAAAAALREAEVPPLPNGRRIEVHQSQWEDMAAVSYGDGHGGCVVSLNRVAKPLAGTDQDRERTIMPDFVLLRSVTRGIHGQDSRNQLFSFMHACLPSVNSLLSAYMCLERTNVFGYLVEVKRRLAKQGIDFPLINQAFYPGFRSMNVTPDVPCVAKVGAAHAGYGKVKLKSAEEVADFKSHLALHGDYATVEPFIKWDWDGRVQKIGSTYRAFKRTSANWKGNVGNQSIVTDMPMTERYRVWIDACAEAFGGLDICGLDILHSAEDDKEYILELNDTAIGLVHKHAESDMRAMRDLVRMRMMEHFYPTTEPVPADKPAASSQQSSKKKTSPKQGKARGKEEEQETDEDATPADRREFVSAEAALLQQYSDENAALKARVKELEAAVAAKGSRRKFF